MAVSKRHFDSARAYRPKVRSVLHALSLLVVLTGLVITTGCTAPPMEGTGESAVPWEDDQPWRQVDSTVLYTPDALEAMAWAGHNPDVGRWYDSRNDQRGGVLAGQQTRIVFERSTTYSSTNLSSSGGNVYDNSHTHTRTRRVEERSR